MPMLSILESIPIQKSTQAISALSSTRELAILADKLGYERYWFTEHHASPDIGCSSPAVLIAHIGAYTSRIRLGSGGVMLSNHAPLVVAEQFATLEALYPGRVDLGIGRASGGDAKVAQALGRDPARLTDEAFDAQLCDLECFLKGSLSCEHPHYGAYVSFKGPLPQIHLLGSQSSSALIAAKRQLPYAFAHHLNPSATLKAIEAYRSACSTYDIAKPHVMITIGVVSAETECDAEWAAQRSLVMKKRGNPDDVDLDSITDEEKILLDRALSSDRLVVGTGASVARRLERIAAHFDAQEVMVVPVEPEVIGRTRTLRTIASHWHW